MPSLSTSSPWQALAAHSEIFKRREFRCLDLLEEDNRFDDFSLLHEGLLLDYSKNFCNAETMRLLLGLAEHTQVEGAIKAMFAGERINTSEDRAALHIALRTPAESNPFPEVSATLNRMADFVQAVHNGEWSGCRGDRISDVVNLGIGGSDLGPALVTDALARFSTNAVKLHFVSNVDPQHLQSKLSDLNPATTLFIIASKSFRTLETHENAQSARRWFLAAHNDDSRLDRHFVAISNNLDAAREFGIDADNLFPVWDWVGGRFSLWSAIGLSVALSIGMKNFRHLLAGAHGMDQHFQNADLASNMPVLMALLTVWYSGFFNAQSTAVVPYAHALKLLPQFLQQLCMESLGKGVTQQNQPVDTNTGEVIWGTEGSNGQHSYFQLLHQGTRFIPVDFIAIAASGVPGGHEQHRKLLANCLSQSLALAKGKTDKDHPQKTSPGNRPSNTLLMSELTPYNLGALLALYEHKVYVQSVIWGINAFDQWGVELGKELSGSLYAAFENTDTRTSLDSSSAGLLQRILDWS